MWEFLNIPDKYWIKKKTDTDTFIRKANLTDTERKKLHDSVLDIELKYDIPFLDGSEIILIDVLCKNSRDKWLYKNVATYIAQSIPYCCVVFTHNRIIGCMSFFYRRSNTQSAGRSVINKQSVLSDISMNRVNENIKECLTAIHDVLLDKTINAISASKRCVGIVEEYKQKTSNPLRDDDEQIVEEWKRREIIKNARIAGLIQSGFTMNDEDFTHYPRVCSSDSDKFSDYYDNDHYYYSIEVDNRESFISEIALCECSYYFYSEFCVNNYIAVSEDIDSESILEWLVDYADRCKALIEYLYHSNPSGSFLYRLGSCFAKKDKSGYNEYRDEKAIIIISENIRNRPINQR